MNRSMDSVRSQTPPVQVRVRRKRLTRERRDGMVQTRNCGTIQIVRVTRIDVENRAFRRRRIADAANARRSSPRAPLSNCLIGVQGSGSRTFANRDAKLITDTDVTWGWDGESNGDASWKMDYRGQEDGFRGTIKTILENGAKHVDLEIEVTLHLRYLLVNLNIFRLIRVILYEIV